MLEALAAEPDPHTTVSEPEAALEVHVADSLSGLEVAELSSARRIADIGAGAGFPGLVLAVALPRAQVDLIESAGRKTAVIDRLIQAAELANARSITARAEELARRAAGAGWRARGLRRGDGAGRGAARRCWSSTRRRCCARTGSSSPGRARATRPRRPPAPPPPRQVGMAVREVLPCSRIPASENRHLHVYRKIAPTPERFPRRAGMARKRPLA